MAMPTWSCSLRSKWRRCFQNPQHQYLALKNKFIFIIVSLLDMNLKVVLPLNSGSQSMKYRPCRVDSRISPSSSGFSFEVYFGSVANLGLCTKGIGMNCKTGKRSNPQSSIKVACLNLMMQQGLLGLSLRQYCKNYRTHQRIIIPTHQCNTYQSHG